MSVDATGTSDQTAGRSGRQRRWWSLGAVAAIVVVLGVRPEAALACVGDCNGDGTVAVTELVTAVNIALGSASLSECTAVDMNGDGTVAINELVAAVNSALGVCAGPTVTLTGSCAAPGHGSHGLKPCAANTPITVFRCDDRTQCLHQQGLKMIGATTVADGGGWSVQIAPADASAALVFQASIENAVVYRALGFGSVAGLLRAGLTRAATFTPVAITPVTEAGVDLLDTNGFANYSDAAAQQVLSAVEQATADLSFENITPDMAAAAAVQTASQDPMVMMVLQTVRNTATPTTTATSTLTPTVTPTSTVTSTAKATPTPKPTHTATPTSTTPTATPVAACYGDCNGDGEVTINELVTGVNIALGVQPLSACPASDANHDGAVDVSDVVTAVDAALNGCPVYPAVRADLTCDDGAIIVSSSPPPSPTPGEGIVAIGSTAGLPDSQVTFAVTLQNSLGLSIAGVQNDITFDSIKAPIAAKSNGKPDCQANNSTCIGGSNAGKACTQDTEFTDCPSGQCGIHKDATSFAFQPPNCSGTACTGVRAIVLALGNTDIIPDGSVLYTCNVSVAAGATEGPYLLGCANAIAGSFPPPTPTPTITLTPTPTETLLPGEVELQVGSAVGPPGSRVAFDVRLRTTRSVAGTQNDITFSGGVGGIVGVPEAGFCSNDAQPCTVASDCAPASPPQSCDPIGAPACTANPLINKRGTTFAYEPPGCCSAGACPGACTGLRALVLSTSNVLAIPDGSILYTCAVDIAPGSQPLSVAPLTCSNSGASDPLGSPVTLGCEDGQVTVGGPGTPTSTFTPLATSTPTPTGPTATPTRTPTPTETLLPGEVELQVGSTVGQPGSRVDFDVRLRTTQSVAGTQNDITFSSGVGGIIAVPEGKVCSDDLEPCTVASDCVSEIPPQTCNPTGDPDCTVNPLIHKDATAFAYQPAGCCSAGACPGACTSFRTIVLATNNVIGIPDGSTLYTCGVDIAPGSVPSSVALLTCSNPLASGPQGNPVDVGCENGQITVGGPGTPTPTVTATPTPPAGHFVDNGDGTITDSQTGLIWEKKDQGSGLHDFNTLYFWAGLCSDDNGSCQPDAAAAATCSAVTGGAIGCAQCAGTATCNTSGYSTIWQWLNQLNAASFAGHNDWRIPAVDRDGGTAQLETIVDTGVSGCGVDVPCVPPTFDTGCTGECKVTSCSCTQAFGYWSATPVAGNPPNAWGVYFLDGGVYTFSKAGSDYVRAVRGGL